MKISRSLCLSLSLLACMSLCGGAKASHAATFYVATTGNDANPGTAAAPFRTLLKGVQTLRSGDTLIVKQGTYAEGISTIPSGSAGAHTTLQAAPGEAVTLQAPSSSLDSMIFFPDGSHHITVDGFILDENSLGGFGVANNDLSTIHHLVLRNLKIKNMRNSGILILGSNLELRNLYIHHNGTFDMTSTYEHGIYFQGNNSLIIGCVIHDNASGYGIQNYSSAGANPTDNTYLNNVLYNQSSGGLWISQGANHLVANNIVYNSGNLPNRDTGALVCCGSNSKIYNNVVYNNSKAGIITINNNDVGAEVKNNIVYLNPAGNIVTINATVSNNLITNPSFVDPAKGDFRLLSSSAAIDAGVSLSQVPVDYDNMPRPQGSIYDIGAYEYRPGSGPASVPTPRNLRTVSKP